MKRAPGDSTEQRSAEQVMIAAVAQQIGCSLVKQRIDLPNGSCLEVDGCNEQRTVLCEAWAHQGAPKSAQKMKVITDASKLFLAGKVIGGDVRRIFVFADDCAAAWFRGRSWMAEALRTMQVEVCVIELPADVRASLITAQKRQYR